MGNSESNPVSVPSVPLAKSIPTIRIVHVSDTHCNHDDIDLPRGDILIHTGDFCDDGTVHEFADFNRWLGKARSNGNYPLGVFVVLGNHDYKFLNHGPFHDDQAVEAMLGQKTSSAEEGRQRLVEIMVHDAQRRAFFAAKLSNARVLDNELLQLGLVAEIR